MLDARPSMEPDAVVVIRRPLARTGEASAAPDVVERPCSTPLAASKTTTAGAREEATATSAEPPSLANPAGVGQTRYLGTSFGSSTCARARSRCQAIAPDVGSSATTDSRDR